MSASMEELFGPVISTYTRHQAIEDGDLVDVSSTAIEAGFKFPVAVTARLWNGYIVPRKALEQLGQSVEGRLWDTLFVLRYAINKSKGGDTIHFKVIYKTIEKHIRNEHVELWARIGPGDKGEPVITVMLVDED